MDNVIKYVKNRVPNVLGSPGGGGGGGGGGAMGETPYLNLEDSVSVNKYSTIDDRSSSAAQNEDENGIF